ncbi:hypothetical protein MLD38_015852 [Melastoma candidum]|uniref:Uncharacterized protein n=1 Tax=Melastoma candidum TaxID=119954 RepID=A0ACB9RIU7_9MYRT|nr:hypothetical protein MLD38_015852 [Melastoma candidum]
MPDLSFSLRIPWWWAEFKAVFGQSFNMEGIVCSVGVFFKNPYLAQPHVKVQDVRALIGVSSSGGVHRCGV